MRDGTIDQDSQHIVQGMCRVGRPFLRKALAARRLAVLVSE